MAKPEMCLEALFFQHCLSHLVSEVFVTFANVRVAHNCPEAIYQTLSPIGNFFQAVGLTRSFCRPTYVSVRDDSGDCRRSSRRQFSSLPARGEQVALDARACMLKSKVGCPKRLARKTCRKCSQRFDLMISQREGIPSNAAGHPQ